MSKKKKNIIILILCIAGTLLIGFLVISYLYNYEKTYAVSGSQQIISINDWQEEHMDVYSSTHFDYVEKKIGELELSEPLEITSYQRNSIRSCISKKTLEEYRRLWYRYDLIIMYGNELKFMIDLENGVVFCFGVASREVDGGGENARDCIMLSEIELSSLKKALKGTGIKNTD